MTKKVLKKINYLKEIVLIEYGIYVDPFIFYGSKSISTLGYFDLDENSLNLDLELLEEFGDLYIDLIVVHEFAHAVVEEKYPFEKYGNAIKPHGKEFKEVCKLFGIPGSRKTNGFENSNVLQNRVIEKNKKREYIYKCNCKTGSHYLSKYQHKQVTSNEANYSCGICKSILYSI